MAGTADAAEFSEERAPAPGGESPGSAVPGRRVFPGWGPDTTPSPIVPPEAVGSGASREDFSSPVRPYFFTRGRTRSAVELQIETLVSAVPGAARPAGPALAAYDHCQDARSVAEVAALMGVPLGVARVLLGDLAEAGAVVVHDTAAPEGPALALMQRVLIGLRNL